MNLFPVKIENSGRARGPKISWPAGHSRSQNTSLRAPYPTVHGTPARVSPSSPRPKLPSAIRLKVARYKKWTRVAANSRAQMSKTEMFPRSPNHWSQSNQQARRLVYCASVVVRALVSKATTLPEKPFKRSKSTFHNILDNLEVAKGISFWIHCII